MNKISKRKWEHKLLFLANPKGMIGIVDVTDFITDLLKEETFKAYLAGREEGINMFNKINNSKIAVL